MAHRDVVEPLHRCSKLCRFEPHGRRCLSSGNTHRCSSECVVTDSEGNYVCSLLGLVLKNFMLNEPKNLYNRRRSAPRVRSHVPWIREALETFLASDRCELVASARRRATSKIRRELANGPASLRGSMAAFQRILGNISAQRSMNHPLPPDLCDVVLDELGAALCEYWNRVGCHAFGATRQSVYTCESLARVVCCCATSFPGPTFRTPGCRLT